MKFKKRNLIKLLELYENDVNKFVKKLRKSAEKEWKSAYNMKPKKEIRYWDTVTIVEDSIDNILDYSEGYYNLEIIHSKWTAFVSFFQGKLDYYTFTKTDKRNI